MLITYIDLCRVYINQCRKAHCVPGITLANSVHNWLCIYSDRYWHYISSFTSHWSGKAFGVRFLGCHYFVESQNTLNKIKQWIISPFLHNTMHYFYTTQCTFSPQQNALFLPNTMHYFSTTQWTFFPQHNALFIYNKMRYFSTIQCTISPQHNALFLYITMHYFSTTQCIISTQHNALFLHNTCSALFLHNTMHYFSTTQCIIFQHNALFLHNTMHYF